MPAGEARKYLLLDGRVIDHLENVVLAPGTVTKDPKDPLFVEDRPWEVRFDNLYPNIHFDPAAQRYACWYNPFISCNVTANTPPEMRATVPYRPDDSRESALCYATSSDGIAWEKPRIGLYAFDTHGHNVRPNNIVLRNAHGVGVFQDDRDDPDRRFKAFMRGGAAVSRDGIHWDRYDTDGIGAAGDTHNNAFWDPDGERYVGITRTWDAGQRVVARTESQDFRTWTKAVEIMRSLPGEPHRQTYALVAFPYAGNWLGLVMILDTETDRVEAELAFSPDTVSWQRICPGAPILPLGPEGSYDGGCIYAAARPIAMDREVHIYYGGSDDVHGGWRKGCLALARLRIDGFAGMRPIGRNAVGTVVTMPVRCTGKSLRVSADVVQGGELRAEVVGVPDLALDQCKPSIHNATDAIAIWRTNRDLTRYVGRDVRLRFELRGAKLYSFSFSD